jgi:hypothetical protein
MVSVSFYRGGMTAESGKCCQHYQLINLCLSLFAPYLHSPDPTLRFFYRTTLELHWGGAKDNSLRPDILVFGMGVQIVTDHVTSPKNGCVLTIT